MGNNKIVRLCRKAFDAGVQSQKGSINNDFNFNEWLKETGLYFGSPVFSETKNNDFLGIHKSLIYHGQIDYDGVEAGEGDIFECASGYQLIYKKDGFILSTEDSSSFLPISASCEYFINIDKELRNRAKRE